MNWEIQIEDSLFLLWGDRATQLPTMQHYLRFCLTDALLVGSTLVKLFFFFTFTDYLHMQLFELSAWCHPLMKLSRSVMCTIQIHGEILESENCLKSLLKIKKWAIWMLFISGTGEANTRTYLKVIEELLIIHPLQIFVMAWNSLACNPSLTVFTPNAVLMILLYICLHFRCMMQKKI